MPLQTTSLSSKGQVVIPAALRASLGWTEGLELSIVNTGDAVLLKKISRFPPSTLEQVVGVLQDKPRVAPAPNQAGDSVRAKIGQMLVQDDERVKKSAAESVRKSARPVRRVR